MTCVSRTTSSQDGYKHVKVNKPCYAESSTSGLLLINCAIALARVSVGLLVTGWLESCLGKLPWKATLVMANGELPVEANGELLISINCHTMHMHAACLYRAPPPSTNRPTQGQYKPYGVLLCAYSIGILLVWRGPSMARNILGGGATRSIH